MKKKDGSWCVCVDYCCLNVIIVKDVYFIFRIEDDLDVFVGFKWFIMLDLNMVYY